MEFNGQIGELGNKPSASYFDLSYTGKGMEELKRWVLETCKTKGLEVVNLTCGKKGDLDLVTARVKSAVGLI